MRPRKPAAGISVGDRFGRWVVVGTNAPGKRKADCLCDCGERKTVAPSSLRRGCSISCGCRRRELTRMADTCHGLTETRVYGSWGKMRSRCTDPAYHAFHRYGGRGIRVCERWMSFKNFLADMGHPPTPKHTIDRINNDGNYEPGNCRWVTQKQQVRNSTTVTMVSAWGETKSLVEWKEDSRCVVGYDTLKQRIRMYGFSPEEAISCKSRRIKPLPPRDA